MTDPVRAELLLVVVKNLESYIVSYIHHALRESPTTYWLLVAVVDIVSRRDSLSNTHDIWDNRASDPRATQVTKQCTLNQLTNMNRNIFLAQDLDKEIRKLIGIVRDSLMNGRNRNIDDPWLITSDRNTTAGHALSFIGGDIASNTANRDMSGKLVKGDEGGESPVGTRAKEPGTCLTAHDEDSSNFPDSWRRT